MAKRAAVIFAILALLAAGAAAAAFVWLKQEYTRPGPAREPVRVEVAQGATVRSVLNQLEKQGAIRDAQRTSLYLRWSRQHPTIKAGTYEVPATASAERIMRMLEQGEVVLEQLTVVEGSRFADFRKLLEQHPAVTTTLEGKSDADIMAALGHPGVHPEGQFFPDTYRFAARTTDLELLRLAFNRMQRVLNEAWEQRAPDLPLKTPYEALILASVVEKETGLAQERPQIAGVFVTRLRKGMRLQSDPTVIYGIGEKYDGDIRTRDLSTDTAYNTYTRSGLPPTPIALPGRESILAAVKPLETGAIYFVAVGDGTGAHYFSRTLEEHNQAVRRYLQRLREARRTTGQTRPSAANP